MLEADELEVPEDEDEDEDASVVFTTPCTTTSAPGMRCAIAWSASSPPAASIGTVMGIGMGTGMGIDIGVGVAARLCTVRACG